MIELSIDELVLRGVSAEQAPVVRAAIERRLGELATEWSTTGSSLRDRAESSRRVSSPSTAARSATELGVSVADSVWSELSGGGPRGSRAP